MVEHFVTTCLDEDALARVEALARKRGLSRDEMLVVLVLAGLTAREQETAAPPASQQRFKDGAA